MSKRRTYNPVQSDVAWQRQLRDQYADDGLPPGLTEVGLNLKSAIVRSVPRSVAEQIILKYEWLGTMSNTRYHFGLFFKHYCAGVTCIAAGTGTGGVNTAKGLGLKASELGILARGACVHWSPKERIQNLFPGRHDCCGILDCKCCWLMLILMQGKSGRFIRHVTGCTSGAVIRSCSLSARMGMSTIRNWYIMCANSTELAMP